MFCWLEPGTRSTNVLLGVHMKELTLEQKEFFLAVRHFYETIERRFPTVKPGLQVVISRDLGKKCGWPEGESMNYNGIDILVNER